MHLMRLMRLMRLIHPLVSSQSNPAEITPGGIHGAQVPMNHRREKAPQSRPSAVDLGKASPISARILALTEELASPNRYPEGCTVPRLSCKVGCRVNDFPNGDRGIMDYWFKMRRWGFDNQDMNVKIAINHIFHGENSTRNFCEYRRNSTQRVSD